MSRGVIERIVAQMDERAKERTPSQIAFEAIRSATTVTPISLEELRKILTTELFYGQVQVDVPSPELNFNNIYDFVEWYKPNSSGFSPDQQKALNSLIDYRLSIDAGCTCKRAGREIRAHQYFEQFWLNNKGTDLLIAIVNIAKVNKVSVNTYCSYTR